jgi:hypothetical protein
MRRWLVAPPVGVLFAISFYESWMALYQAAAKAEVYDPRPWPATVDGFILIMAAFVIFARIDGHTWGVWWPRLGLLGATALSTTVQVVYAPAEHWARALHAWSPLALLASFEIMVWLVFGQGAPVVRVHQQKPPAPARLRAWVESGLRADAPTFAHTPAPTSAHTSAPTSAHIPAHTDAPIPAHTDAPTRPVRALTSAERRRVDRLLANRLSPRAIHQRTGLPYAPVRAYAQSLNGDRP